MREREKEEDGDGGGVMRGVCIIGEHSVINSVFSSSEPSITLSPPSPKTSPTLYATDNGLLVCLIVTVIATAAAKPTVKCADYFCGVVRVRGWPVCCLPGGYRGACIYIRSVEVGEVVGGGG